MNLQAKINNLIWMIWHAFLVDIFICGLVFSWVTFEVQVLGNDVLIGPKQSYKR